jgi:tetratricopeptide (TPR) repeat protein
MLLDVSPREAAALCVFTAALLTAWNANSNGFVWDDRSAVLSNLDAQSSPLADVFANDFWGTSLRSAGSHKSYRPLTILTFRLNFLLARGHSAWLYHFTNALVHGACSTIVWRVADVLFQQHQRRLKGVEVSEDPQDATPIAGNGNSKSAIRDEPTSLAGSVTAGLLFAVHPIHCDAVASIVGRADLLCTSLSLLAFLAYVSGAKKSETKWGVVLLALLLTIAAGLCKELGFTNFALLVVYDLLRLNHYQRVDKGVQRMRLRLAVTVAIGVLAALVRVWFNGEHRQMEWNILANNVVVQESRLTRLLSYAHGHAWYLWKLVWPRWLCFDYGYNTIPVVEAVTDLRNVYTLLAYLVVLAGLRSAMLQLRGSRKTPPSSLMMMSIAFGVVPFVPASNIIFPVGTVVAERLLYFPSVGFCLLVGCIADQTFAIMSKYNVRSSQDANINAVPTGSNARPTPVTPFVFRAMKSLILACGAIILAVGCYRSQLRNAEWTSEEMLFKAAVDVVPTNVKVLSNEAKNRLNTDPQKALEYLRIAIGMIPKHIESQVNAGLAFVGLSAANGLDGHLYLHGLRHLFKAAVLAPNQFQAFGFLGGEMYSHWMKTRQQHREPTISEFLRSDTISRAASFLDRAISGSSFYPTHFYNRGSIAYEAGDFETAISFFRRTEVANAVIRDRKVDPELIVEPSAIYNMLGVCYKKRGETEKALDLLLKGVKLYPEDTHLLVNTALILQEQGRTDEAEAQLALGLMAATKYAHIQTLRDTAQFFEDAQMPKAVEAFLDRAATLERELSP